MKCMRQHELPLIGGVSLPREGGRIPALDLARKGADGGRKGPGEGFSCRQGGRRR